MRIDAIGIFGTDLKKTVKFYKLLGFSFTDTDGDHIEAETKSGDIRLMIDSEK